MEAAAVMAIALANGGVSLLDCSMPFCCTGFCGVFFLPHLATLYFFFTVIIISTKPLFSIIFQGQGPDWQDFVGILCLLVLNSTISFIEENNAGNAAAALMAHLAPKTKVGPL